MPNPEVAQMPNFYNQVRTDLTVKDQSRAGIRSYQRNLRSVERSVRSVQRLIRGAAIATIGYLGVRKIVAEWNELTAAIDNTAKTADKLGMTVEALTSLRYAAERSGVATRTMDMAMQRMTRRVAEAAQGVGEARAAIRELGLSATELVTKSPDQMLLDVASAMETVETQSDRIRLAFKLFDSEGVGVVNMLKDGRAALEEYQRRAARLGATFSRIDARQIEMARDALADVGVVLESIKRAIVIELAPHLTTLSTYFLEAQVAGEGFGTVLVESLRQVALAALEVRDTIQAIKDPLGAINALAEQTNYWRDLSKEIEKAARAEYAFAMQQEGREPFSRMMPGVISDQRLYDEIRQNVESRFMATMAAEQALAGPEEGGVTAADIETRFDRYLAEVARVRQRAQFQQAAQMAQEWIAPGETGAGGVTALDPEEIQKAMTSVRQSFAAIARERQIIARVDESRFRGQDVARMEFEISRLSEESVEKLLAEIEARGASNEMTAKQIELLEKYTGALEELRVAEIINRSFRDLARTMTDMVFDAKNAEQILANWLENIARELVQELAFDPVAELIKGGVRGVAGMFAEERHLGGRAGMSASAMRLIPSALFAGAPRVHGEGQIIKSGEVPVIAKVGEEFSASGGLSRPNVAINIRNESSGEVESGDVGVDFDPEGLVLSVILRDVAQGGPLRDVMRGGR
jgi:hypothetical protein